jgi:K+-transporting ATPase KdpF subunit
MWCIWLSRLPSSRPAYGTFGPPIACRRGEKMSAEYLIVGIIAVALLLYLGYALLRPERL